MISPSLAELTESYGLDLDKVKDLVAASINEDISDFDKTSVAVIPEDQVSRAYLRARKPGIIAGSCIAGMVFEMLGITKIEYKKSSGDLVEAGDTILVIEGPTRKILLGERTALNFLSHTSGIATFTRLWVDAIAGTKATIRDTRKTTPGLRHLEKFAVRVGGGMNHRMNLSDGAIIKDNHIAAAGSITKAVERVKSEFPELEIEVEVDDLNQLQEALGLDIDVIMLDNMTIEQTREAVKLAAGSKIKLESSGGLTLENVRAYAETGVDYLAVGALTHSAPSLDLGLDF